MSKIGIALDPWKLPIFKKELTAAGFTEFKETEDKKMGIVYLSFDNVDAEKLYYVVKRINDDCAKMRMH